MKATAAMVTPTKNQVCQLESGRFRKPKAAPLFSTCTMLKKPGITGSEAHRVYLCWITALVSWSGTMTAAAKSKAVRKR